MKIILVNYRYFISGGPERYYFNIKEILEKHGHEVIPFSVKSRRNLPNDYEKYFLDIVDDDVYFAQAKKKTPKMILKSFTRMFYSFEAKRKMRQLIKDTKPDVVYIMQMHNKISPSIVDAAKEMKVPVVHRISDFQYMCPNALFYNDRIGVCEDCLKGKRWSCVKYRCVLNSPVYSFIKMMAKWFHDVIRVTKRIDAFVVPSEFTLMKLCEYGIPMEKLNHIPTFYNMKELDPKVEYEPYVLFVGRIEKQKGLMTLVRTFEEMPYQLKIIGFSNDGYEDELKKYLGNKTDDSEIYGKNHNIEFLGRKKFEDIVPYLKTCLCTTVPSEWYDNFPNVVLESYAYKKAVIATDFGSLQYMVEEGKTGLKFKYADINDFRSKITYMMEHADEAKAMGENGYRLIETKYSAETHYSQLMKVFDKVLKSKNNNIMSNNRIPRPTDASIILTYRCPMRCVMCNIWKNPTNRKEELKAEDLRCLPQLKFINLTGGEPFIREDLPEIVEECYKHTPRIVISTSGWFEDRVVALAKRFPNIGIRISIEGLSQKNDELRGHAGGFDKGLRTLLTLKHMGLKDIGFGCTVSNNNSKDMLSLYQLSLAMGMEFATAAFHNSFYFHKYDNVITNKDEVCGDFRQLIEWQLKEKHPKSWFRAWFNMGLINYIEGGKRMLPCEAGSANFFIDPWGEVLPCNGMETKYFEGSMGNIHDKPFMEIWESEQAQKVRDAVRTCPKNCWMVGTASPVMHKYIKHPAKWALKNKWRSMCGKEACLDFSQCPVGQDPRQGDLRVLHPGAEEVQPAGEGKAKL